MTAATSAKWADLTRNECLRLVKDGTVGRVVVLTPAGTPVIRPVNYAFDDVSQSVVFRCSQGTKLVTLLRAARAWFEVDDFDSAARVGWSVIIAGVTEPLARPHDVARVEGLALDTWAGGADAVWFRIRARVVSGRRIGSAVAGTESRP
jgi:uncharacterized protein